MVEQAAGGRTFEAIGDEWLAGMEAGRIAYAIAFYAGLRRSEIDRLK